MLAKPPQAGSHLFISRRNHTTLAGRQYLARMETEAGHRRVRQSNAVTPVLSSDGASSVFNHHQTMASRNVANLSQGCRQPNLVNDQDSSGSRSDGILNTLRVHVVRQWVDVNENRDCPGVDNRIGRCDERQAGTQYLISGSDAAGQKRQVESRGAR
jgi:hypothetical protein